MPEEQGAWWKAPAVVAALITGLFTVWVTLIKDGGGDSGEQTLHIADLRLTSAVGEFNERCPTTVRYDGAISVDRGSGSVSYRFNYSDGFNKDEQLGPVQEAVFDGPRTAKVVFDWTPNIPSGRVSRTVVLEILSPASLRSAPVTIRGSCDDGLPDGPPEPPPNVPGPPG